MPITKRAVWAQNHGQNRIRQCRSVVSLTSSYRPSPDRGVADNGMVGDDPGHEQRLEVVDRHDPWRSMPLSPRVAAEAGFPWWNRRGFSMSPTPACWSERGQRLAHRLVDEAVQSTTQSRHHAA